MREQDAFGITAVAAGEPDEGAATADHAMTGHDDRNRVGSAGTANADQAAWCLSPAAFSRTDAAGIRHAVPAG